MSDTQSIYKFVLGLNETGGTLYIEYPLISKYVWTITNRFPPLGCTAQSRSSVITQTTWRPPIFNHRLHPRHHVESVIQNGINPDFLNNSRIIINKCYTNTTYASFQFILLFKYSNTSGKVPINFIKDKFFKFIL